MKENGLKILKTYVKFRDGAPNIGTWAGIMSSTSSYSLVNISVG